MRRLSFSASLKIPVQLYIQFAKSEHLGGILNLEQTTRFNQKQMKRRSPEGWGFFPQGEREEKDDVIQTTIRL